MPVLRARLTVEVRSPRIPRPATCQGTAGRCATLGAVLAAPCALNAFLIITRPMHMARILANCLDRARPTRPETLIGAR